MYRFTIIFLFFAILLKGQGGFKEFYRLQGGLNNTSKDVIMAPNGTIIITGITYEKVNNLSFNRLTLIGLDPQGVLSWRKSYGNIKFEYLDNGQQNRAAIIKEQNHFYQAIAVKDSNNIYFSVLLKFDFSGDTVWQKKYYSGVTGEHLYVQDASFSVDGGILLSGIIEDFNTNQRKILLIKTDLNGKELWRKSLVNPNTTSPVWVSYRALQDSSTKKIISVGYQYMNSAAFSNVLIMDSLGNKLYHTNFSGAYGGLLSDLIQSRDKNFIAVGWNCYPLVVGIYQTSKFQIVKFNINGGVIWSREYTEAAFPNSISTVNERPNGNLILGGNLDTSQLHSGGFNPFIRIMETNSTGNIIWQRDFDFDTHQDLIRSVNFANDGSILATAEITSAQNPHPYILIKLDSTGCDTSEAWCRSVALEVNNFNKLSGYNFELFPNPASNFINLKIDAPPSKNFVVKINDISGRLVEELQITPEESYGLDISGYEAGVYFVNVLYQGKVVGTKRLVIVR